MRCKLKKLSNLSGNAASVYSLIVGEEEKTLFETFLEENMSSSRNELSEMVSRIKIMGNKIGARENFFKINEGNPGDLVCALYDNPNKHLRLYCIRYGSSLIILGGGGVKNVRALQDDPKLAKENSILRELSTMIKERMDLGEIEFSSDYLDLEGNLTFNDENYE